MEELEMWLSNLRAMADLAENLDSIPSPSQKQWQYIESQHFEGNTSVGVGEELEI